MMNNPTDPIDQLRRDRQSLEAEIDAAGSTRKGQRWQCPNPDHEDKHPSAGIYEDKEGVWRIKCHSCSFNGDIFDLRATRQGRPVADVLREAKAGNGHSTAKRHGKPKADTQPAQTFATAREAAQSLAGRLGKPSGHWAYQNGQGEPVGVALRWSTPDGGKTIRPIARDADGRWRIGAMAEPRPLFQLPALAQRQGEAVYVCEGEKTADAAASIGLLATTSAGGSKAAAKADWSPLAGREVVVLPDADSAGEHYAEHVAAALAKQSPRATVRIVHLPGLPEGGDIADLAEACEDCQALREHVEQLAAEAEPVEASAEGEQSPPATYQPFPVHVLPEPLQTFTRDAAASIGCDPANVALPLLAACAGCVGMSRRIQLKRGWREPSIVWTAVVAKSGQHKTPAQQAVLSPLQDIHRRLLDRHEQAMQGYEANLAEYQKQLKDWQRSKHSEQPSKPEPPQAERLLVSDTTTEALAPILQTNPRGVTLSRDELAGWLGSFDRYAKGGTGGADAARWLSIHVAESVTIDRKVDGTTYVRRPAVSIAGGIQPERLRAAVSGEHTENGLLARLLLAMPPNRPKRWTDDEISEQATRDLAGLYERLRELELASNAEGERVPVDLPLTPDAKQAFVQFVNEHGEEQAEMSGDLAAAWSKLESYAARLALVIQLVAEPEAQAVGQPAINAGVTLARWFANEARHVYGRFAEGEAQRELRHLAERVERKGGSVTIRDWQRSRSLSKAEDAKAELGKLAEADLGYWDTTPHSGPGRPCERFTLDKTPRTDTDNTDKTPDGDRDSSIVSVSSVSVEGFYSPEPASEDGFWSEQGVI